MTDVAHKHYAPSDELEGIESDVALISLVVSRIRAQRNSASWVDATNANLLVTETYNAVIELIDCISGSRRYYTLPGFKGEVKILHLRWYRHQTRMDVTRHFFGWYI